MANCVSVMNKISSPSLAIAGEHGKRDAMHARKPQAVSDWGRYHPLGALFGDSVGLQLH